MNITRLASTPLPQSLFPDAVGRPTHLGTQLWRLVGLWTGGHDPVAEREPFQTLAELLHAPGQLSSTIRIGVRGPDSTRIVSQELMISALGTEEEVRAELISAGRHVERVIGGRATPWWLKAAPAAGTEDWPTFGSVSLIRQRAVDVETDDGVYEIPLRFTFPGADSGKRLINAILAHDGDLDVFITLAPTTLRHNELALLEAARAGLHGGETPPREVTKVREQATVRDLVTSMQTELWLAQLAVVSANPTTETTLRAIGGAFTAPFDSQRLAGYRVVARPNSFVGGGFALEPCRRVAESLELIRFGIPALMDSRRITDLMTSSEVASVFSWVTDRGEVPGLARTATRLHRAPNAPNDVTLGTDIFGESINVGGHDRHLHSLILGGTGSGKTTLMHNMIAQDIEAGRSVVVVDPHGDLINRVLAGVPERRHLDVVFLDASSGAFDRTNLAKPNGTASEQSVRDFVSGMVAELNKDFVGPVFDRAIRALLLLWAAAPQPFEITRLASVLSTPSNTMNDLAGHPFAAEVRQYLREAAGWSDTYRNEMVGWVIGKTDWLSGAAMRRTFASPTPTVDLARRIEGSIICVLPGDEPDHAQIAMNTFLGALLGAVRHRSPSDPTIGLYLDELQLYGGSLVRRAFNELRKRAVAITAATQAAANVASHIEVISSNAGTVMFGRCTQGTAYLGQQILQVPGERFAELENFTMLGRTMRNGSPTPAVSLRVRPSSRFPSELPTWLRPAHESHFQLSSALSQLVAIRLASRKPGDP